MDYPERIDNHIKESDSITILNDKLPSSWIVREISERDYGIDLYVEIVGTDKKATQQTLRSSHDLLSDKNRFSISRKLLSIVR